MISLRDFGTFRASKWVRSRDSNKLSIQERVNADTVENFALIPTRLLPSRSDVLGLHNLQVYSSQECPNPLQNQVMIVRVLRNIFPCERPSDTSSLNLSYCCIYYIFYMSLLLYIFLKKCRWLFLKGAFLRKCLFFISKQWSVLIISETVWYFNTYNFKLF